MKYDFLAISINLSRKDRIKAHFMKYFISLLIYRILKKKLDYKYTTTEIINTLKNIAMIKHKGLGFKPVYERTDLTYKLHDIFKFNTDYESIINK